MRNPLQLLDTTYNSLKNGKGMSVIEHINEFNVVISQLNLIDIDFDNDVHALILLFSMNGSWNTTNTTISNSFRSRNLMLDKIRDIILSEDIYGKNLVNLYLLD